MAIKECVVCGGSFEGRVSAMTCSNTCRAERSRTRHSEKYRADAEYRAHKAEYSAKRYEAAKAAREPKPCVVCGGLFSPSNMRSKTCSNECKILREKHTDLQWKRRNPVPKDKKLEQRERYMANPGKREAKRAADLKRDHDTKALIRVSAFTPSIDSYLAQRQREAVVSALQVMHKLKECVVCGSPFVPLSGKSNTCSEECWFENRVTVRRRPEAKTDRAALLEKKRQYSNDLNAKRAAAYNLIKQIEKEGLSALL